MKYQDIELTENKKITSINRQQFLQSLINNIKRRLVTGQSKK